MKKLLGFVLFFVWIGQGYGQIRVYETQKVELVEEKDFVLARRWSFSKDSRYALPIDLPANTTEWVLVLETIPRKTRKSPVGMLGEILKQSKAVNGVAGKTLEAIVNNLKPEEYDFCNAYLTDEKGKAAFFETAGLSWLHNEIPVYQNGKHQNVMSFKSHLSPASKHPMSGRVYLCIDNPDAMNGLIVRVTAVATVKTPKIDGTVWSPEIKNYFYNNISNLLFDLLAANEDTKEYAKTMRAEVKVAGTCMADELFAKYKPNTILRATDAECERTMQPCIDAFLERVEQLEAEKEAKEAEQEKLDKKAEMLGNMAWEQYEKGDIDKCIDFSLKANQTAKLDFVNANLGLAYLVKGDLEKSIEHYFEAVDLINENEDAETRKEMFEAAIADVEAAIKKKGSIDGANQILELLKAQLNRA